MRLKRYDFIAFLMALLFAVPAMAATSTLQTSDLITKGPWVDVRVFSNLSTAKASSSTANKTILIPPGTHTCGNLTIPADRTLKFMRGGVISVNSGKTLTFSGQKLEAGEYQIFSGSGTVAGLSYVKPEWFGAATTATGSANSAAMTKAIAALTEVASSAGTLSVFETRPGATYKIAGNPAVSFDKKMRVAGNNATFDYEDGTGIAVQIGKTAGIETMEIDSLRVRRNYLATGAAATEWVGVGIYVLNVTNSIIKNPYAAGFAAGMKLHGVENGCAYNTIYNPVLQNNVRSIFMATDAGEGYTTENTFIGGRIVLADTMSSYTGTSFIYHEGGGTYPINGNKYIGVSLEGNAGGATKNVERKIYDTGTMNLWERCRFETSNGGTDIELTSTSFGDMFIDNIQLGGNVFSDSSEVDESVTSGFKHYIIDSFKGIAVNTANPTDIVDIRRHKSTGDGWASYWSHIGTGGADNTVSHTFRFKDAGGVLRPGGGITATQVTADAESITSTVGLNVAAVDGNSRQMFTVNSDGRTISRQRSASQDRGAVTTWAFGADLADDATTELPSGTGLLFVTGGSTGEYGILLIKSDGSPVSIAGSSNLSLTDADGKLCVYDGGDHAIIKNRLGSTVSIRAEFKH